MKKTGVDTRKPGRTAAAPKGVERAVEKLLRSYPAEVQGLAQEARKRLFTWLPGAGESVDAGAAVLSYGYGPGYKGMVCTLILGKSGVKLGLVRGAALDDPERLLAGSGRVHRHIQLHSPSDLDRPGVRRLVKATLAAWKDRA